MNPHIYSQLFFDTGDNLVSKSIVFQQMVLEQLNTYMQKNNILFFSYHSQKLTHSGLQA